MSDQKADQNLNQTIESKDLTEITLVLEEDQRKPAHSFILATSSFTTIIDDGVGFPCDKCKKSSPNDK